MPKIFKKDVEKIPYAKFREVKIMVDGELKKVKQAELRRVVAKMTEGGKTLTTIERQLIKAGLEGMQWGKRKDILKLLGGEEKLSRKALKKQEELAKKEKIAMGRRAYEMAGEPMPGMAAEIERKRENPVAGGALGGEKPTPEYLGLHEQEGQISALNSSANKTQINKKKIPSSPAGQPPPSNQPPPLFRGLLRR